jgi:heat shock protein HtpX
MANIPNLYHHKDSNIRKTWFLLTVFLVMIIALGYAISFIYNAPEILYIAVVISMVMNIVAYWQSDKIALASSGARPVPREGNEYIYRMVENLAITAGLPMPRIYVMDSPQINAFATGRDPQHAAVAVTTGAVQKLENEELEGVLAHELAHIGNRDILLSTVLVVLAGVISIASDIIFRSGFRASGDSDNKAGGIIMVVALVAAILAPIAATLIQLAVSRKREFLADATGALITRYPEGLARALEKIHSDSAPMRHAHSATAHMFLASPFKGRQAASWLAKLFTTHPPIEERVAALRGMDVSQLK